MPKRRYTHLHVSPHRLTSHLLNTALSVLTQGAARVSVCALLDKAERREVEVQMDYVGVCPGLCSTALAAPMRNIRKSYGLIS